MAFAVLINRVKCTGCNNCVDACSFGALELHTVDPSTTDTIYKVRNGKTNILDFKGELCAG
jgi:Fe-S-cluster-containing hydrogenase component 2